MLGSRSCHPTRQRRLKFTGHQSDFYDVWDQRFLGDERFVEQIDERIRADREIEVPGPRARFSELLRLTAAAYGMSERELVQPGRQRKWVRARSTLVYVAREWGKVTVKLLGRRLHRDPLIISRLYMTYAANRDRSKETFLAKQLRQ